MIVNNISQINGLFNFISADFFVVMYWDKSIQRCARGQLRDGANRKPSTDPSSVGK
jgi:hypothetical protein